jgi:hypothetical protein
MMRMLCPPLRVDHQQQSGVRTPKKAPTLLISRLIQELKRARIGECLLCLLECNSVPPHIGCSLGRVPFELHPPTLYGFPVPVNQRGSSTQASRSRSTPSAYWPSSFFKGNAEQSEFFTATRRMRSAPKSLRPGSSAFSKTSDQA